MQLVNISFLLQIIVQKVVLDIKKKFDSLGLNIPSEEIFSSSFAAAAYFEQINFKNTDKSVYGIREIGICEELDLINVKYIGGINDIGKQPNMGPNDSLIIDNNVGAVVVGFDLYINYYKIQYALPPLLYGLCLAFLLTFHIP